MKCRHCFAEFKECQEVDFDKIDAKLEHGILRIRIPKLEKSKDTVKKIVVK